MEKEQTDGPRQDHWHFPGMPKSPLRREEPQIDLGTVDFQTAEQEKRGRSFRVHPYCESHLRSALRLREPQSENFSVKSSASFRQWASLFD